MEAVFSLVNEVTVLLATPMPAARVEPSRLIKALGFESSVSAIPPDGRGVGCFKWAQPTKPHILELHSLNGMNHRLRIGL